MSKKPPVRANLAGLGGLAQLPQSDNVAVLAAERGVPMSPAATPVVAAVRPAVLEPEIMSVSAATPTQTYEVGSVVEAPLQMLVEDPFNARDLYTASEVDAMAVSLQQQGQDVPVCAYYADGKLWVYDGVKRLKGARIGGIESLRVEIKKKPESELEIYLSSRRMNLERSAQSALDDAIRWEQLLSKGLVSNQSTLAEHVGKSTSYVSQVLGINRIPRDLLAYMKERPTTTDQTTAYKLSTIFSDERRGDRTQEEITALAKKIIDEVHQKNPSRSEIDRLIERTLGAPRTRAKSDHQKIKCFNREGVVKTFPSKGKFELSISGLKPEQLTKVEQRIKAVLEEVGTDD